MNILLGSFPSLSEFFIFFNFEIVFSCTKGHYEIVSLIEEIIVQIRTLSLLLTVFLVTPILLFASSAFAIEAGIPHLDGATLSLIWGLPFAGILLSIAIFPLIAPEFWHHHFGKISAFWAIMLLFPFAVIQGVSVTLFELAHVFLLEYFPFIILLLCLFTVAGGVRLKGNLVGSPIVNTGLLVFGTCIASWMGTTGAAMLLIRPLLRANEHRRYRVHTVVFFIFLVANIGGSLTPLGDPPLFLGFLKGVSFFWPMQHMFMPMLLISVILLIMFFCLDSFLYRKETIKNVEPLEAAGPTESFGIEGKFNLILLVGVVGAVLMSGTWKPGISFSIYHVQVELQNIARDISLLMLTLISWWATNQASRIANGFSWFPIVEVAKLFACIFLTIMPVIAILRTGTDGALGDLVDLVSDPVTGAPNNMLYFWLTGILSSILDNAPTYLVFFNTAGGDPIMMMGTLETTLLAISAGAVFMGANTYIGNAPNFMVRSIAEENGVPMPSFFGYMLWSSCILMPIFAFISWIYFS